MTAIEIVKHNGEYRGFECHGHAGYAEEGEDIVCSAISVLTINTVNSIDHFLDDEVTFTANEKEGIMQCYFCGEPSKEASLLMDSLVLGLESIVSQYGKQYIRLEIREV